MKKIFACTLALPPLTSIFFIMCSKQNTTPEAAPDTPNATITETSSSSAEDTSQLERIEFHTESVNGATHWAPSTLKVKAGKKYLLVAKHELATGFDFHGLQIKDFDILAQVNRGKEFTRVIDIPADKKGNVTIGCQFHPKHVAAQLIIE